MNTDISEIESEIIATPAEEKKPRRKRSVLAFLSFVMALAALIGTAWMWWQDELAQDEAAGKVFTEIARLESADSELAFKLQQMRG